ncbi:MAG: molybdopterin molybdotransferase MoeA [Terracidiphilus sp.]
MSQALLSYEEAAAVVLDYAALLRERAPALERVDLAVATGRTLAKVLRADRDQPAFARSTRDGFACRAEEARSHEPLRVAGSTRAGQPPSGPLPRGAALEIMTGAPVPDGADAVMMIEHVEAAEGRVRLLPPRVLEAGENIVAQGAQAHAGEELLPAGTTMGAGQIALAASCGLTALDVCRRPRVAIVSTGDELVPVEREPGPGQIRNSSSPMLAAMVAAAGAEPWILPTAADDEQALDAVLAQAATAEAITDLVLVTGGVSAGKFDLVEPALARAGARFEFTGVRVQPGKPLVFAEMPRGEGANTSIDTQRRALPLFGLPGNPVSSAVTFLLFAAPVIAALGGRVEIGPRFALAQLSKTPERRAKGGLTRFLPALCTFGARPGSMPEVAPVSWQGSGDLAALGRCNCFMVLDDDDSRVPEAGGDVRILLI